MARVKDSLEAQAVAQAAHAQQLVDLYVRPAGALLEVARDTTPFLVENTLPAGGLVVFAGDPGGGKSWLAYDLALALVQNRPWLGRKVVEAPARGSLRGHRVLVLNYDNPDWELGRRFRRLGLKADDPVYFHSMCSKPPPQDLPAILQLPMSFDPLMAIVDNLAPTLIVVDSMRQAHTLDEDRSADMGRVMACLKGLMSRGATVLALHHLRKRGAKDVELQTRGSGEIEASCDVLTIVTGEAAHGKISWKKVRGWLMPDESRHLSFAVSDEGDTTKVEVSDAYARLRTVMGEEALSKREIYRRLGLSQADGRALVEQAEEDGVLVPLPRKSAAEGVTYQIRVGSGYDTLAEGVVEDVPSPRRGPGRPRSPRG